VKKSTTWLLTGGAGYIGAHVLRALQASGRQVVVMDDLSTGLRSRVPLDVPFVEASVLDRAAVQSALREFAVDGVVHLAAKKAVGESVENPLLYYQENVGGVISLLQAMAQAGTAHIVYSSSAAVYGEPTMSPIDESTPCRPLSPYGETKLIGEWLVRDAAQVNPLSWIALRYFNVAGEADSALRDTSANNLIPMVYAALDRGERPQVFGSDYPTVDGTCIRDYIHVVDVAHAHVAAAARCEQEHVGDIYNVGRGKGSSVWEVMSAISASIGQDVGAVAVDRRAGDPPELVASAQRIEAELGWRASLDLASMVKRA
jgi:UDP-glucose 4-epimerase